MAFVGLLKPHLKHFSVLCVTKESSCVLRILGLCHFSPNIHNIASFLFFFVFAVFVKGSEPTMESVILLVLDDGSNLIRHSKLRQ